MREAAFKGNGNFEKDLETLMHRRCILLKFMTDGKLQTLVVNVKVRTYGWREGSRQTQVSTHNGH